MRVQKLDPWAVMDVTFVSGGRSGRCSVRQGVSVSRMVTVRAEEGGFNF